MPLGRLQSPSASGGRSETPAIADESSGLTNPDADCSRSSQAGVSGLDGRDDRSHAKAAASGCASRVRRATWRQVRRKLFCALDGRMLSSRMSGTFCGGSPTRPALSTGFIRTRDVTPLGLNGSRGHANERLARSARPAPWRLWPMVTGRGPGPRHRDDAAHGVGLGLVGSTHRRAAHLVRRLHVRLHGIEVADRGVGVIFVGLQGFHHGRAR